MDDNIEIKGTKFPLSDIFDKDFISKFQYALPSEFKTSCNHAILFTDIIGSSQIYHSKGDSEGLLIATQKYEIANKLCHSEKYLNHIKIIKTMGDALFIICEDTTLAYSFTKDLISEIKVQTRDCDFNLRIRATLHYGNFLVYTPPVQNTVDCFGESINNAARLEGENKRLIIEHFNSEDDNEWNEYPILMSGDFFSELSKTTTFEDNSIKMCKAKIREYNEKKFLAYLVKSG